MNCFAMGDYAFRVLQESDLALVLEWRNSPRVHSKMLTDHKITWEEHKNWFQRIQNDPIKKHFIFTHNDMPVGYRDYSGLDLARRTCYGSSYIGAPDKCPKDAGIFLFFMGIDYAFSHFDIDQDEADVFADNTKALKLNKFLGYEFDHTQDYFVTKDGEQKLVLHGVHRGGGATKSNCRDVAT